MPCASVPWRLSAAPRTWPSWRLSSSPSSAASRVELTAILRGIGALSAEDRPRVGALANELRQELEAALAARRERLEGIALEVRLAAERARPDPARTATPARLAAHPIMETMREIARIFGQFGFVVYDSPEVETDALNFQALNIPVDHPGPRPLGHVLRRRPGRGWRPPPAADAYLAGSDQGHARGRSHRSGPCCRAAAIATRRSTPAMASSSSRSRA